MPHNERIGLTGGISTERIPSEFVLPPPIEPPPPPVPEWHFDFLVYSIGSPSDDIEFSLWEDIYNNDTTPPIGSSVFTSGPISFPHDGALHSVRFTVPPDGFPLAAGDDQYVMGAKYWIGIYRTNGPPYDNMNYYRFHFIGPFGGNPAPTEYSWYDGSTWHKSNGTIFCLGGYNLPVGANGWTGNDNGVSGGFGVDSAPYIAQRFVG